MNVKYVAGECTLLQVAVHLHILIKMQRKIRSSVMRNVTPSYLTWLQAAFTIPQNCDDPHLMGSNTLLLVVYSVIHAPAMRM